MIEIKKLPSDEYNMRNTVNNPIPKYHFYINCQNYNIDKDARSNPMIH